MNIDYQEGRTKSHLSRPMSGAFLSQMSHLGKLPLFSSLFIASRRDLPGHKHSSRLLLHHERGISSALIHIGSAFPCLKVGLQAQEEVFPACVRLLNAIASSTLHEIMLTKEQPGPLRDRCEIPGDRGPLPIMWGKPHAPMHFLYFLPLGIGTSSILTSNSVS
jgi:hypothetical protein